MRTAGMARTRQFRSRASARAGAQYGGNGRPEQCTGHGVGPAQRARERVAAPAVDREQHELVNGERGEHEQRLLERGLGADALVLAHADVGDERQRQRVLPQHRSLKDIEREAGEEPQGDVAGARRVHRPVQHREYQEHRPQDVEPWRQRQHGEHECHERREQYPAAAWWARAWWAAAWWAPAWRAPAWRAAARRAAARQPSVRQPAIRQVAFAAWRAAARQPAAPAPRLAVAVARPAVAWRGCRSSAPPGNRWWAWARPGGPRGTIRAWPRCRCRCVPAAQPARGP